MNINLSSKYHQHIKIHLKHFMEDCKQKWLVKNKVFNHVSLVHTWLNQKKNRERKCNKRYIGCIMMKICLKGSKEIQAALQGTLMTLLFKAEFCKVLHYLIGRVWLFRPRGNSCLIFLVIVCRKYIIKEGQDSYGELGSQVLSPLLIPTTLTRCSIP